ncbi:MAG: amidohydrolase family protein [Clostridiales bacterium]|nr:amidohydrolase family protein [Clostridiales bacterium]
MFIDIHSHAYRITPPVYRFCTPEQLIRRYDKMKVETAVLLPVVNPEIYFPQAVEEILEMCDKYPGRFVPYCNIDPRSMHNSPFSPLDQVMSYYKDLGCKGVGEIMPTMELMDLRVQNLFACAEKVGLPVVYDGSGQKSGDFGIYDDPGLPQLEYSLVTFPKLLIFGHGPLFWNEIARLDTVGSRCVFFTPYGRQVGTLPNGPVEEEGAVPRLMRKYPNLMGDLSDGTAYNAIARDDKYGPRFLTEFQDRLFFGTDMCFEDMPVELDKLLIAWTEQGKISKTVFRKISYDNAARLLGL